jgi:hypothetical protein
LIRDHALKRESEMSFSATHTTARCGHEVAVEENEEKWAVKTVSQFKPRKTSKPARIGPMAPKEER